ncbi:hypothetical protein GXW78_21680 [Roseomonas terrae]|jgi:hypothetical protein|uniref:Uncharacterized protein n=1 Tax=Neoroseomonas terrae TaxID=424799 RepID=A0ABS5EMN8_9PROT|nr:hypothetical protein [Neoroseomonas terrae]MBR0652282.1 hypothetical protein [Neoroseomonas terrae]
MLLRLIGLLLGSLALVIGLSAGWNWTFGAMLGGINPRGMATLEDTVRNNWAGIWDSLALPMLGLPAWAVPALLAVVFFLAAAMRPGRG